MRDSSASISNPTSAAAAEHNSSNSHDLEAITTGFIEDDASDSAEDGGVLLDDEG
jgi:hypothetical protein|eukprot:COSAG03_NODE_67_length_15062_cov_86.408781_14_plen_55_part_00